MKFDNRGNKQKGLAAIELTIILPFMFLMLFAIAEFGRMLYQYNALNHLVRDALRFVIIDAIKGDTGQISLDAPLTATTSNILKYGQDSSGQEQLPNLANATVTLTSSNNTYVTLTVNYQWQPMFFTAMPSFISSNAMNLTFPLKVTYTMRALRTIS